MARTSPSEGAPAAPAARLFVALEPSGAWRRAVARWCDGALGGAEGLRLVAAESLHVTLAFLGSRPEAEIGAIAASVEGACQGVRSPVCLWGGEVVSLPPRRPRLVALSLEDRDGCCAMLQASIADALAREGFYAPERRPFWPHVTLARVRRGGSLPPRDELPDPPRPVFEAKAVTLYRSTTRPAGAVYEALTRVSAPLS